MNHSVVEDNWELVENIARRIKKKLPKWIYYDDLVSAGSDGLMQAAARYKEDQGCSFKTFATIRIRGAIWDWMRQEYGARLKWKPTFVSLEYDEDDRSSPFVVKDNEWHKDPIYFKYEPCSLLVKQEVWDRILKHSKINHRHRWRNGIEVIDKYYSSNASLKEISTDLKLSESRVSQIHTYLLARFAVMISLGIISEDMFHAQS